MTLGIRCWCVLAFNACGGCPVRVGLRLMRRAKLHFQILVDSGFEVIESDENNNQRLLPPMEGQAIENVDPTMIRKRMESMEKKN